MNNDIKIELEFYFVWDGMIILKSYVWDDVMQKAVEYYNKYGKDHTYNLYSVNKYDFKDLKNKE